jgi:hypothetical protein
VASSFRTTGVVYRGRLRHGPGAELLSQVIVKVDQILLRDMRSVGQRDLAVDHRQLGADHLSGTSGPELTCTISATPFPPGVRDRVAARSDTRVPDDHDARPPHKHESRRSTRRRRARSLGERTDAAGPVAGAAASVDV